MVQTKTSHLGKVSHTIILLGWRNAISENRPEFRDQKTFKKSGIPMPSIGGGANFLSGIAHYEGFSETRKEGRDRMSNQTIISRRSHDRPIKLYSISTWVTSLSTHFKQLILWIFFYSFVVKRIIKCIYAHSRRICSR